MPRLPGEALELARPLAPEVYNPARGQQGSEHIGRGSDAGTATDHDEFDPSTGEQKTKLARKVGPLLLLFFIVGDILGGGIYALAGEVGAETGGAIWTGLPGRVHPRRR